MTKLFYFIIIYGLVSGFLWGVTVAMAGSFTLTLNHVLLVQVAAFPLFFVALYILNKTSSFLGNIMTGLGSFLSWIIRTNGLCCNPC